MEIPDSSSPSIRRTTPPHRKAPYLDAMTIKPDAHAPHSHLSNSGQLLLQPTVIPDLGHIGLQVPLEDTASRNNSSPLFYSNGGRSATLNMTIRNQVRDCLNDTSQSRERTQVYQPTREVRRLKKDGKRIPPTLIPPSSRGRSHDEDSLDLIKAVRTSSHRMTTVIKNRQAIVAHPSITAKASAVKS